jgi:membrane-associated phospholipid phosphatase
MDNRGRFARVWDHTVHPSRRAHGIRVIAAIVILLVSAIPIEPLGLSETERSIFESINQLPDVLVWVLAPIMELGNFLAIVGVSGLALWVTKRRRLALDLALSGASAWLLSLLLKEAFGRGRPGDLLVDVIFRANAPESGLGFVSGHAAVATALATVIAAYTGPALTITVAALAATVAFARIYVGAHLPLDVIGGAALGWAIGSLIHFLVLPEVLGDDEVEI